MYPSGISKGQISGAEKLGELRMRCCLGRGEWGIKLTRLEMLLKRAEILSSHSKPEVTWCT